MAPDFDGALHLLHTLLHMLPQACYTIPILSQEVYVQRGRECACRLLLHLDTGSSSVARR